MGARLRAGSRNSTAVAQRIERNFAKVVCAGLTPASRTKHLSARLTAKTRGFDPRNRGSIPRRLTTQRPSEGNKAYLPGSDPGVSRFDPGGGYQRHSHDPHCRCPHISSGPALYPTEIPGRRYFSVVYRDRLPKNSKNATNTQHTNLSRPSVPQVTGYSLASASAALSRYCGMTKAALINAAIKNAPMVAARTPITPYSIAP